MQIGFIGVGVMGEPMCRNLVTKSGHLVRVFDANPEPVARLVELGAAPADSVATVATSSDVVFLSLPGGPEVQAVGTEVISELTSGTTLIDTSTSPVDVTRELSARAAERDITWLDAPIARTRAAAEAGTLAVMIGGPQEAVTAVRPLIECYATDISYCGVVGCGQIAKVMNNMVLFQNVVALAEAITIARRAGMEPSRLLEVIATGSGDSFALHNHATKAMLPGAFPLRAFSTDYARKDLSYALALAASGGVATPGADVAKTLLDAASEAGLGEEYWPTILNIIDDERG